MNPFKEAGVILLQGLGLGLAIVESVARPIQREPELPNIEYEDEEQEQEQEQEQAQLIPDSLESLDLRRPGLGQHQTHANTLMEQAAALGALRNGLQASGFDHDEAWILTRMYARLWWSALHEREPELEFDEDDD